MGARTRHNMAPRNLSAAIPRRQALLLALLALLLSRGSTGKLVSTDYVSLRLRKWHESRRRAAEDRGRRETETPL